MDHGEAVTTFAGMNPSLSNRSLSVLHILLLCISASQAQVDLLFDGNVPVDRQGVPLSLAWSGGINYTQVGQIDLDQDGLKDLFFFDRTGNKVTTLLNTGGSGTGSYVLTRSYDHVWPFAELHDWVLLRDYDCDGKEDIFTYSLAGFSVYRNISTPDGLAFELLTFRAECDFVFTDGTSQVTNLYVSSDDLPGLADVDGDGDMDVLTFSQLGSYVEYYKNLSLETYGTCDSLAFERRNVCWGRFSENVSTNDVTLNADCQFQVPNPEMGEEPAKYTTTDELAQPKAHAGSTVTPIDLDGDGVMDLLLGDISYANIVALGNGGTVDDSFMTSADIAFPNVDNPVNMPVFPGAFYLDVTNDGKRDLLVSPNARSLSQNYESVWFYQNIGTDSAPVFEFQQRDLFQNRMLDFGEGAYPVPFDHNGDGLMDLIVANDGYYHPSGSYIGKLALLENIGTATAPAFSLITDDYMGLSTSGIGVSMYPTFGDVDGDGDLDMYVGDLQGRLHFFRNTATGPVAQFELALPNITNAEGEIIDVGRHATPQFVDLDEDGLVDLIAGEQNGNVNYLRNTGTSAAPAWTLVTDSLGKIRTNTNFTLGHSVPFIYTSDAGEREILVASESGWLWHYTNIEGNLEGTWDLEVMGYLGINEGFRTGLCVHDLTGDGELDLVVGNYRGGLSFWRSDVISDVADRTLPGYPLNAYPNPTTDEVVLEVSESHPKGLVWVVRNALGQQVAEHQATGPRTVLNLEALPDGLYLVRGEGQGQTPSIRIVKE